MTDLQEINRMPVTVTVYTVETGGVEQVTDEMSAEVREAVPRAVRLILDECDTSVNSAP